ncbi:MAG: DUF4013 domain-containing protein [Methanobrevibacter sp.]|jgi:hypothetical protein|nr:DUF4013 domain-containing protein [Methanobrevibacter sp.]
MSIGKIFKESLKFPKDNLMNLGMLGVLFLVSNAFIIGLTLIGLYLPNIGGTVSFIGLVIGLLINFIIMGYSISIIKNTIFLKSKAPEFELKKNLENGIKSFIIGIIYSIIPVLILVTVGLANGFYNSFIQITNLSMNNFNSIFQINSYVPQTLLNNFIIELSIIVLIGVIIGIIFALFYYISICIFAKTESLTQSLNMKKIVSDIRKIGWINYTISIILLIIISIILIILFDVILTIVGMIPVIGLTLSLFISMVIFAPYLVIFQSRTVGLIYNEKNK